MTSHPVWSKIFRIVFLLFKLSLIKTELKMIAKINENTKYPSSIYTHTLLQVNA